MTPRRNRPIFLALTGCLLACGTASALAQGGGTSPTGGGQGAGDGKVNPCLDGRKPALRCPDLIMYRPYDLFYDKVGGRTRLHAGNSIVNVGRGPAENFGVRSGPGRMKAVQHIYAGDGTRYSFDNGGRLVFKHIPGQGGYWKFYGAARFELWTLDSADNPVKRVRIGAKLVYCLRDLNKRFSSALSPRTRHFPGCNQNPGIRSDTLGTSVGWSDDYPATYAQQYIDVSGLRGDYAFFQRVDPFHRMWESNEANNRSPGVILRLPPRVPKRRSASSGY